MRFFAVPLILMAATVAAQDPPRYVEKVDVARVLVDARALDGVGRPLLGLTPANFQVKIDGKVARLESVTWVTGALAEGDISPGAAPVRSTLPVEGRLVVFLFQKSMESHRIVGFMRMLLELKDFIEGFTPRDRIAVLSFDSRLRLWLDFTSDMDRVRQVLERNLLFVGQGAVNASEYPSLYDAIGPQQSARTYTIEGALQLIANALTPLPGAKTVVLVGHGFGRLGLSGVMMENNYEEAAASLQRARASVFCLDVTTADYHSLEAGLQIVAEDTGGFFERTHIFTERALNRLSAVLAGHYVLIVEKPEGKRGYHRIEVKLKERDGTVMARNAYVD